MIQSKRMLIPQIAGNSGTTSTPDKHHGGNEFSSKLMTGPSGHIIIFFVLSHPRDCLILRLITVIDA